MSESPLELNTESFRRPLFSEGWVRRGLVGAVGLYLFMVCAAYFGREVHRPDVSCAVFGPGALEPNTPIVLRVVGYKHIGYQGSRSKPVPIAVKAAHISALGKETKVPVTTSTPAIPASVHLPSAPERPGDFSIRLTLSGPEVTEKDIVVPLVVYHPKAKSAPVLAQLDTEIPKGDSYGIELLFESDMLALGMLNQVWVRVTHPDGKPASNVRLKSEVSGAEASKGALETDIAGLAKFQLVPNSLSTKFVINAIDDDGDTVATLKKTVIPIGGGCKIWMNRQLYTPEEPPLIATVQRKDRTQDLYCDLYRNTSWLKTWHLPSDDQMEAKFEVTLPTAGAYTLQCYTHYQNANEKSADVVALFRYDGARHRAMKHMLRQVGDSKGRDSLYHQELPIVDVSAENAFSAIYGTQNIDPIQPALVYSTRKQDITAAQAANDRARAKFFLLIGSSFGLVLLWAIYTAIHSAIRSRIRMAQAIEELGEMAVDVTPPTLLLRALTLTQATFIVMVLILNIIAMLELFQYI